MTDKQKQTEITLRFKRELLQLLNKWDAELAVENFSKDYTVDYRLVANIILNFRMEN